MRYIYMGLIIGMSWIVLGGCAPKSYTLNESRFFIIKSPKLKFADLGYIRSNEDEVRADLFVVGKLVQSIEVSTLVCVNEGCLSKSAFNEEYLSPAYPDELILNVLLGRPIFNKASFQRTDTGFKQALTSADYNIAYKVDNGDIYFKDTQNRLMIKILKVQE